jgi:DNA-binding transcriptional LysR family regulator
LESVYLKTLVEVVRTGSLSRAAETLHVTQPAVSKRIRFMEEQYGCALLDYSGNRMRPTRAGELVYEKARALLEIESELVTSLHLLHGKAQVAFASTPAFGVAHLPFILKDFLLTCSDMAELKLVSATPQEMHQGLAEGVLDAAVIESCERYDLSAFTVTPLPDSQVLFAAAPALAVPEPLTSVTLLRETPIFTRREGCCSRTLLEQGLRQIGLSLADFRRVIVIDDLPVLLDAVLAGGGVTFLPLELLEEDVKAGRLKTYRVEGFQFGRRRALVLAQAGEEGDAVSQLAAAVLRRFSAGGAAEPATMGAAACLRPASASAKTVRPRRAARRSSRSR